GDGWVRLPDGTRRWGRYGAAGLLLYSLHPDGTPHVLLQHRAAETDGGGTWAFPGGALDRDESPREAAFREFSEEVTGDLGEPELIGTHAEDLTLWRYDTFLAYVPDLPTLTPKGRESSELRWVPAAEATTLPLHPALRNAWPHLHEQITA
ncbi:NUDIX hydrolase, partial [Nocardiopsis sp. LOL_012]|uniref:NUDIX hydrolase n=1 Tax=Nocardiopsis sp. LOL_012 TaxID=3345409 RepID=UPI003A8435D7